VTPRQLPLWAILVALVCACSACPSVADDGKDSTSNEVTSPLVDTASDPGSVDEEIDVEDSPVEMLFGLPGRRSEHYIIYSQLSMKATRDLSHRLEAMYDYYADRFADVYSPINFPKVVVFFNNRNSFVAAGGHPTMPGQFMSGHDGYGARLMMLVHEGNLGAFMTSCPLMYHEGFHQFVSVEISQAGNVNRQWPLWLDEAYATNFNNITWTGDGFVDGHGRLEIVDSALNNRSGFIPLRKLVQIDGATWHAMTNAGKIWPIYMEGWSLVHFLCTADKGRYRPLLDKYVLEVSTGKDPKASLRRIIALQSRYSRWFTKELSLYSTGAKYYEIFVRMATSLLARAHAKGQQFDSGEDFLEKAKGFQLKLPYAGSDQWLPDSLPQEMLWYHNLLTESFKPFKFEIIYPANGSAPFIRASQPRFGLVMEGRFELDDDGKVVSVEADYVKCPSLDLAKAKRLVGTKD
jgi:hypothetical protein